MNKFLKLGPVALFAFASAFASAQWVVTNAGPFDSDGPVGSATNGSFSATYSGANALFGALDFSGNLTSYDVGSFLSEARWNITNTTTGSFAGVQSATGTTWTGTQAISKNLSALVWVNTGDTFNFEAYESYDDPTVDAYWDTVSFNFNSTPTIVDIGTFASGTDFTFDTEGTTSTASTDTELALFKADGTFLLTDDDGGTGLLSLVLGGVLPDGDYMLLAGGYDSGFASGFAFPGNADITSANVNINATSVWAGAITPGYLQVLKFKVGGAGGAVTGNIVLQDWVPGPAGRTVSMEFYSGFSLMGTGTATLDMLGNYTMTSPVADGTYTVIADAGRDWLRKKINAVTIAGGGATGVDTSCLNGNIIDDTVIDLSDYTALLLAFNTPGANEDVNGDGIVDLTDYIVVVTNFNAIEDTP